MIPVIDYRKTKRHGIDARYASSKLDRQKNLGAGEGIRTLDPDLGKVVLYP